ncbi:MAG: hypothetical protein AB7O97_21265 [Planctomycetota bacterium]
MHIKILAASAIAALAGTASAQCSNYSLTPPGSLIHDADDALYTVALPFLFPFNGTLYDKISISSNGWVKIGASTSTSNQLTDSESLMLSDDPRIAVCWDDLNAGPVGSGDIFYRADVTQASVTYQGVQRFGTTQTGTLANCELVLLPTGDIYLYYDATCTFNLSNSSSIVGISAGGNLVGAGTNVVDWSLASPGPIGVTQATAYELFTSTTGLNPFDLNGVGITLHFQPTGVDTYNVVQIPNLGACPPAASYPPKATGPITVGAGCPAAVPNGSIYESFTTDTGLSPLDTSNVSWLFSKAGDNYTALPGTGIDPTYTTGTVLTLGDETVLSGISFGAMGNFPFADLSAATFNLMSNGFIRLDGSTANDFSPTAAELNTQGARIAGCWKDLNPGFAGTVYLNDTDPNFCMVTFDQVAEFGQTPPLGVCTFQIKMFVNGDVQISHGAVTSVTDNVIVGITRGAALDPGSSDLATGGAANIIGPVDIVGVTPLTHTSNTLQIGQAFSMNASPAPFGVGFFIIGTSNPNLPLDGIGMTGCTQYASLDNTFFIFTAGTTMSLTLPVPYDVSFGGVQLFTQAAAFSPANPFGVIASNGLDHTIGL